MSESVQSGRTYLPRRLPPLLLVSGAPEVLEEFHMSGTAQTKPKLHARLRHLRTGRLTEHTFLEGERVPIADAQYRRARFSYHDGQDNVFSDAETFEELTLSAQQIGERRWFIKENGEYRALFINGRLVGYYAAADRGPGSGRYRCAHPRWCRRRLETGPSRHQPGNHGPALHRPWRENPRGHNRTQIRRTRKRGEEINIRRLRGLRRFSQL